MSNSKQEFEAWAVTDASPLFPNEIIDPLPDGTYRTSGANAAWTAWQAARVNPVDTIASQLDSTTLGKLNFLMQSNPKMHVVGVVALDDVTMVRATIDMGRVTFASHNEDKRIMVPPIETVDLIARLQASIGDAECYEWKSVSVANIRAAIALISSQPVEPQIDGYPLWSGLPPPAHLDADGSSKKGAP